MNTLGLPHAGVALAVALLISAPCPVAADGPRPAYSARVTAGKQGVTLELRPGKRAPGKRPRMDDVVVFVPRGFAVAGGRVDWLVHIHGQVTTARREVKRMDLVRQVVRSRKNVVLVVPQGPIMARKNRWGALHMAGGLARMLDGVLAVMAAQKELSQVKGLAGGGRGRVLLSVHSGGYSVAAHMLRAGGAEVSEVFLFDALFGYHKRFLDWTGAKKRRRLVTFYARKDVRQKHALLLKLLRAGKLSFVHHQEALKLRAAQLTGAPVVVIGSRLGHYTVVHQQGYLRMCLASSP